MQRQQKVQLVRVLAGESQDDGGSGWGEQSVLMLAMEVGERACHKAERDW